MPQLPHDVASSTPHLFSTAPFSGAAGFGEASASAIDSPQAIFGTSAIHYLLHNANFSVLKKSYAPGYLIFFFSFFFLFKLYIIVLVLPNIKMI